MAYYADTSALVKLVARETETEALLAWLRTASSAVVSSDLARTELLSAVRRRDRRAAPRARDVLDALTLVTVAADTLDAAGLLDPDTLRSLDAIHIASALELGDELEGMLCYDDRMSDAAASVGIRVIAPR